MTPTPALTSKEKVKIRTREWRKQIKDDPNKSNKLREYHQNKYLRYKEKGLVKNIDDLTAGERLERRAKWRQNKHNQRSKKRVSFILIYKN